MVYDADDAVSAARRVGYPVVVKPLNANHGRGVSIRLTEDAQVEVAFATAREHSRAVLVESFLDGLDHRLLVVNGELIAASKRMPGHVVGDGERTVEQLVEIVNQDPRRGVGHEKVLTRLEFDEQAERMLAKKGYDKETVPAAGEIVFLRATANSPELRLYEFEVATGKTAEPRRFPAVLVGGADGVVHRGPFDGVLKLSDVSRPRIPQQQFHRCGFNFQRRLLRASILLRKMRGQDRDVLHPFSQGWQLDLDDVEPIKQILTEFSLFHEALQRPVRRSDHAHVDLDCPCSTHALERPLLQNSQQFDLHSGRHITDFIQKNGAAVRLFKPPLALPGSTSEGPFLVAEQFAFKQVFWQCRTIDRHQWPRAMRSRGLMNRLGHHLFARTRLAVEQNRRVGRSHIVDELEDFKHAGAFTDDVFESVCSESVMGYFKS